MLKQKPCKNVFQQLNLTACCSFFALFVVVTVINFKKLKKYMLVFIYWLYPESSADCQLTFFTFSEWPIGFVKIFEIKIGIVFLLDG